MGDDTGRNRGVSGISRGVNEIVSCTPEGAPVVEWPLEFGGGVTGDLNILSGRTIFGLKPPD